MAELNDEIDTRPFDRRLAGRLLALLRPQRHRVLWALLLSLVSAAIELSGPLLLRHGIDHALANPGDPAARSAVLLWVSLAMAAVAIGNLLAAGVQGWLVQRAGQEVLHGLRSGVLVHLLSLPMSGLLRQPVGRLLTRAVYDPATINEFLGSVVVQMTRDLVLIAGCAAVLLWLDWRLFIVVLAAFPLLMGVSLVFRNVARRNWRAIRAAISRLTARLAETLSGLDEIQLARGEGRARAAYAVDNDDEFSSGMRQVRVFAVFQPSFHLISVLALVAALAAGSQAVAAGAAGLGAVVAAIGLIDLLFRPVRDLAEKYNVLQSALASAERVAEVLDGEPEDDPGRLLPPPGPGVVAFENVWFAYGQTPAADDDAGWVLRDLSFRLAPGRRLALVGASGAGKTTVVALLLRLYAPQRGRITLDGVDIRDFDLVAWRRRVGLVLQEAALMAGSIAANLRAGHPEGDPAVLQAAAVAAGLDRLPGGGLERQVGEGGRGLSAGERQLVAMARALAADAALLVLDEATAHVDSEAEAGIQTAIDRAGGQRGLLLIAHRLATVRACHEILVMEAGRVIERGSRAELLAAQGRYAALERLHAGEAWDESGA